MFRKMRRFKQQITDEQCIEVLKNSKRGVLSLIGEDEDTAIKICTNLTKKFTDDEEYLQKELKNALPRVQCLELIPEHMTGKLVNES